MLDIRGNGNAFLRQAKNKQMSWFLGIVLGMMFVIVFTTWSPFSAGDQEDHRVLRKESLSASVADAPMILAAKAEALAAAADQKATCPPCRECLCPSCEGTNRKLDERHGQVTVNTPLGKAIYQLAKEPSIELILETGTLDGTGASRCMVAGLEESGTGRLISIEAMKDWYDVAKRNLAGSPATVLFGTPVDASEMPSKEEVRKMVGEAYAQGSGTFFPEESEWGRWWDGEHQVINEHEVALMEPLCNKYRKKTTLENGKTVEYSFDLMLLDAGEFTGLSEFKQAMEHCRPRYLALHDAQTFKHWFTVQELNKPGSGYEPVDVGLDARGVGHAVYKRIN